MKNSFLYCGILLFVLNVPSADASRAAGVKSRSGEKKVERPAEKALTDAVTGKKVQEADQQVPQSYRNIFRVNNSAVTANPVEVSTITNAVHKKLSTLSVEKLGALKKALTKMGNSIKTFVRNVDVAAKEDLKVITDFLVNTKDVIPTKANKENPPASNVVFALASNTGDMIAWPQGNRESARGLLAEFNTAKQNGLGVSAALTEALHNRGYITKEQQEARKRTIMENCRK